MAINLLAIISIVFVIFAAAIIVLFVLHFKHKPKSETSAITTLQNQLSSLQSTVTDLQSGKGQSWGPWTINKNTETNQDEFQICHNGKVQLSLKKNLPGKDPKNAASDLWVQNVTTGTLSANNVRSLTTIQVAAKIATKASAGHLDKPPGPVWPILIDTPSGTTDPKDNKWNYAPCGSHF